MMPEATVNEDYGSVFRHDDVGFAGKVFCVKPEPEAVRMQLPSHDHLGGGARRTHLRHKLASLFAAVNVHVLLSPC